MRYHILILILFLCSAVYAQSTPAVTKYLFSGTVWNATIPTPDQYLGNIVLSTILKQPISNELLNFIPLAATIGATNQIIIRTCSDYIEPLLTASCTSFFTSDTGFINMYHQGSATILLIAANSSRMLNKTIGAFFNQTQDIDSLPITVTDSGSAHTVSIHTNRSDADNDSISDDLDPDDDNDKIPDWNEISNNISSNISSGEIKQILIVAESPTKLNVAQPKIPTPAVPPTGTICTSNWQCSTYSPCLVNNTHARTCIDLNYCFKPTIPMPQLTEACTFTTLTKETFTILNDTLPQRVPVVTITLPTPLSTPLSLENKQTDQYKLIDSINTPLSNLTIDVNLTQETIQTLRQHQWNRRDYYTFLGALLFIGIAWMIMYMLFS